MWRIAIRATPAWLVLVAMLAGAETLAAAAADSETLEPSAALPSDPAAEPRDTTATIDPAAWATLDVDAAALAQSVKPWRLPPQTERSASEWKRAENPNGTAQFTVNKPLPLAWDAKVGADLNPAASTPGDERSERPLPVPTDRGSGAAWLNVAVPNIAAVELRVNSSETQNRVGASFIRSLPLGEKYAVTFENRYAVVEPLGSAATSIVPSGIAPASKTWSTDRLVKFGILASGTTLAVGTTSSTADNVTHSKLIAEQKIYGPLNISTALTDVGAPTAAKSISAGFKFNW